MNFFNVLNTEDTYLLKKTKKLENIKISRRLWNFALLLNFPFWTSFLNNILSYLLQKMHFINDRDLNFKGIDFLNLKLGLKLLSTKQGGEEHFFHKRKIFHLLRLRKKEWKKNSIREIINKIFPRAVKNKKVSTYFRHNGKC